MNDIIGTDRLSIEQWEAIKKHVQQGGKKIIELRGRSSFQSPSHQTLLMVKAVMDGKGYPWPVGCYVNHVHHDFNHIMMAMETTLTPNGVSWVVPAGTQEELHELHVSYGHLCKLRDEVIAMGVLPPLDQWKNVNPHLT